MTWHQFAIRLVIALLSGSVVGAERQWRQRTAGLCTNSLVAMGAAMFVRVGGLIGGADGSHVQSISRMPLVSPGARPSAF